MNMVTAGPETALELSRHLGASGFRRVAEQDGLRSSLTCRVAAHAVLARLAAIQRDAAGSSRGVELERAGQASRFVAPLVRTRRVVGIRAAEGRAGGAEAAADLLPSVAQQPILLSRAGRLQVVEGEVR